MNNEGSTLTATVKGTKSSLTIDDEEYFDIDLGDYEIYVAHNSLSNFSQVITFLEHTSHSHGSVLLSVFHNTSEGVQIAGYSLIEWLAQAFSDSLITESHSGWTYVVKNMDKVPSLYNMDPSDIQNELVIPALEVNIQNASITPELNKGAGATQDVDQYTTLSLAFSLAEQGDARGQYNLGVYYADGKGVPKNDKAALNWYTLAAEQGLMEAQFNLGWMYYIGQGSSQNYGIAFKWFTLSAEQGNTHAQYNLGLMHFNGQGVPQSYEIAIKWFTLATDQGHNGAQLAMGKMYAKGLGVTQNNETAIKWYTLAGFWDE